jgi:hypothetical protein
VDSLLRLLSAISEKPKMLARQDRQDRLGMMENREAEVMAGVAMGLGVVWQARRRSSLVIRLVMGLPKEKQWSN